MKHEPDPDDPARCRASDLLLTDCSGCRGSDESFVNALLRSEPEPDADYGEAQPADPWNPTMTPLNPLDWRNRGAHGRKWWLDTGPETELKADSKAFASSYTGGRCAARCGRAIRSGQLIVHLTMQDRS